MMSVALECLIHVAVDVVEYEVPHMEYGSTAVCPGCVDWGVSWEVWVVWQTWQE